MDTTNASSSVQHNHHHHQPRPLQMGAKGAYIVRLLMVGDSACGKTSLVLRFDQNVFSTKFVTTIGVDYRDKMVKIENAPMRLQLWDTAGQERFRSLTSNFFGRADGFVLTYDISNRPSFDHVIGWMRDIKTRAPPDCDIILCGNKCDLDNDRVVTIDEGKQLADEYGVQFYETSALTGHNVEKIFIALATTIKHKRIDEFDNNHGMNGNANGNTNGTSNANGSTTNGGNGASSSIQRATSNDNTSAQGDRTVNLSAPDTPGSGNNQAKSSSCC